MWEEILVAGHVRLELPNDANGRESREYGKSFVKNTAVFE